MFNLINKIIAPTLALLLVVGQSEALTYNLNFEHTGGTQPVGSPPWATATFTDVVGGVQLDMSFLAQANSASEFISTWLFNFNPAKDITSLTFTANGTTGTVAAPTITAAQNSQNGGAGYKFDIGFDFQTSAGTGRFNTGEAVSYVIGGIAGLTANDFNFPSTKNNSPDLFTDAHVQGIGTDGGSGWITQNGGVPEPSTYLLLGSMLGLAALLGRRKVYAKS